MKPTAQPIIKIAFFGDSISFGQGVSIDRIWVTQCARELAERFGSNRLICINPSINGNTTRMALERMPHDIQSFQPHLAVVQFGLNDANFWVSDNGLPRVHPKAFEANIYEIISRLRACGTEKIIINTNHLTDPDGPPEHKISPKSPVSYRRNTISYNQIIRDIASKEQVILNDIEQHWNNAVAQSNGNHGLLLDDGLHLSEKAHFFYKDIVIQSLSDAVQALMAK
jgi:lysophospholipase L1-like esterase